MQGKLYAGAHDVLDILGLAGDLGNGLLYFVSRCGLGRGPGMVTTADYGTRFIVVGRTAQRDRRRGMRTIFAPGGSR